MMLEYKVEMEVRVMVVDGGLLETVPVDVCVISGDQFASGLQAP